VSDKLNVCYADAEPKGGSDLEVAGGAANINVSLIVVGDIVSDTHFSDKLTHQLLVDTNFSDKLTHQLLVDTNFNDKLTHQLLVDTNFGDKLTHQLLVDTNF